MRLIQRSFYRSGTARYCAVHTSIKELFRGQSHRAIRNDQTPRVKEDEQPGGMFAEAKK
jgi:hypothetical protein